VQKVKHCIKKDRKCDGTTCQWVLHCTVGWDVGGTFRKMKRVTKGIQDLWEMKGYDSKLG
jgi:hypothetical protein